jgi:hypothetical protein
VSKYLPRASREVVFDGDKVVISINRISMSDALAFKKQPDAAALRAITEKQLRAYDLNIEGLKDAKGGDIGVDLVLSEFYFSNLVNEAADLLMSTGEIPQEKAAPLDASSTS